MAVVAEWLRRWTRNPLGSARAGSNPADCVTFEETQRKMSFGQKTNVFDGFSSQNLAYDIRQLPSECNVQ